MEKSTVVQYIFALNREEVREFGLWLNSPLHNSRQELIRLFEFIVSFRDNRASESLTKRNAFTIVFFNEKYEDKRLRYAMSFLLQQVKGYIIWKAKQNNQLQNQITLLKELRERNLSKYFEQELKKTEQIIDNQVYRNADYFYKIYELNIEKHEFFQNKSRGEVLPIKEVAQSFSIFTIVNTLKWQCNLITHKSILLMDYEEAIFQELLVKLEKGLYREIPVINIYYHIYKALKTGSIDYYKSLKLLANNHFEIFSKNETRDVLLLSINFCIKRLNEGNGEYLVEIFDWYKKGLETTALIRNGELSRFTYNNIAIAGLKLEEFEWTKSFLDTYKKYISTIYQDDIYYFNLALWYQYQNQYDEVLQLLLQANFKDVLHGLHAKQIIAKIYYETNAFDALESLIGSIKVYLHRHKKLGYHKQNYMKLIKYLKKLIKLNQNNKRDIEELLSQIQNETTLLDKAWFIRQLEK